MSEQRVHVAAIGLLTALAVLAPTANAQAPVRIKSVDIKPTPTSALAVDTLWRAGDRLSEPPDAKFTMLIAMAADSNGHILALDAKEAVVRVFDSDGRYVRSVGRAGSGPGEFRFPLYMSVAPDGSLLVFDAGIGRATEFSPTFQFVRATTPAFSLGSPASMIATDDEYLLTGTVRTGPYQRSVIHAFSRQDGRHARSFGSLPPAGTDELARLVGAGVIAAAQGGGIWYTQRAPYLIQRYSSTGQLQLEIQRPNDFLPRADSSISVAMDGYRMTTTTRPHPMAFRVFQTQAGLVHQVSMGDGAVVTDVLREACVRFTTMP